MQRWREGGRRASPSLLGRRWISALSRGSSSCSLSLVPGVLAARGRAPRHVRLAEAGNALFPDARGPRPSQSERAKRGVQRCFPLSGRASEHPPREAARLAEAPHERRPRPCATNRSRRRRPRHVRSSRPLQGRVPDRVRGRYRSRSPRPRSARRQHSPRSHRAARPAGNLRCPNGARKTGSAQQRRSLSLVANVRRRFRTRRRRNAS